MKSSGGWGEEDPKILTEWNCTERDYPRDSCIHHLFQKQVERTPDAIAVVFNDQQLTYKKLNALAERVSRHMRAFGVAPHVLVGFCILRSITMVVGLLGILLAGGAYWAVEENLPKERWQERLANSRPKVILYSKDAGEPPPDVTHLAVSDRPLVVAIEDLLESEPDPYPAPPPPGTATDPAYVSYTSGSTGQPKGVVIPHRGVVRLVKGADYASLDAGQTLMHLSPLAFDASTFELWGALLNGGKVVIVPAGPPTLAEIGEIIRRHQVTTIWLTAGLFHLMVDERIDDLKPLRQLLSGGDVLSPEHIRKALRALPDCRIINGYGPTENTTFTCCYTVTDERELTPSVPIGRPIANTQVYLLDEMKQPVPLGATGEIYAGGDGVACGYLNQPEMTAESFFPDPFSATPGARLYRTGDLARLRPDGNLEFLGRADSQVKIRGHRIELAEIDRALNTHPDVASCMVIAEGTNTEDQKLTAYIVARKKETLSAESLRYLLMQKFSDYMIPSRYVEVASLPLNPNGKVDRKALLKMEGKDLSHPVDYKPPQNELEQQLAEIWQRLFQREKIGRFDNFFDLGGHSLLAARLGAEIAKHHGLQLPIATIFQSPTIESLARRFDELHWSPSWTSLVSLRPQGTKPPLFFIHGVGGDVFLYMKLTRFMEPDQPTFGLQAVGLDGTSPRHLTVEEMAAHYAQEIISYQTQGPIYLAGYSLGGVLAFAIARELHRLDRRVAFLALLDATPTGPVPWIFKAFSLAAYIPSRIRHHFGQGRKLSRYEWNEYLRGRFNALRTLLSLNRRKPAPVAVRPAPHPRCPHVPGFLDYYHAVSSTYQLAPYPGPADVFISEEITPGWNVYWRYLARGGVRFHEVEGLHNDIITHENMPQLARLLTAALHHVHEKERAGFQESLKFT